MEILYCSKCGRALELKHVEDSYNRETGDKYVRSRTYECSRFHPITKLFSFGIQHNAVEVIFDERGRVLRKLIFEGIKD
jgi:hypothetical protein